MLKKGVIIMGESRLDVNKLNSRIKKVIFTEEALKDVTPIEWSDDILSGKRKLEVTNAEKDCENKCVKLEISYL
jgi:hypothetical protein